jgi:pyrophosphatase PpaX
MKSQTQLVIWDVDGTLASSLRATIDSFLHVLSQYWGRSATEAEIAAHFGFSELKMVERLVGRHAAPTVYQNIRQHMHQSLNALRPFEGIETTLKTVKDSGLTLAVYTGRGREGARFVLSTIGLQPYFDLVLTSDDVRNPKPHPEGVMLVCRTLNIDPAKTIMIGDSHMDLESALGAGARALGCTWDQMHTCRQSPRAHEAAFVDHPYEVLRHLGLKVPEDR